MSSTAPANMSTSETDHDMSSQSSLENDLDRLHELEFIVQNDDDEIIEEDDEDDEDDDDYEDAEEDFDMDDEDDNPDEDDENDFDDPSNEHEVGGVRFRLVAADEVLEEDEDGEPLRHIITMDSIPFRLEILGPATSRRRRNRNSGLVRDPLEYPSPVGRELMRSGHFGSDEGHQSIKKVQQNQENRTPVDQTDPADKKDSKEVRFKRRPLHVRLMERELGLYNGERVRIGQQLIAQTLVPQTKAEFIMHFDSRCYSGQFSRDGNFFFACAQDYSVHMYDTSNPLKWKHYKTAYYPDGRWTITDATLSPDNSLLAYSSIASTVYAVDTTPDSQRMITMDFAKGRNTNRNAMHPSYAIWSIRFSGDGKELVAGSNDHSLYTYDVETGTVTLKLSGHEDDINAVCFGDQDSPHILYSGSDDCTVKVWDRRSMASGHEAGVFAGHIEGVTYVDSKGDGRYVLSNGKDQTMKLWDIRKMISPSDFRALPRRNFTSGFDYRSDIFRDDGSRHPNDGSLVTYRGHQVLKTLIRCHFSPPVSSGSRYVYSGSSDGKVHIYNIDGTPASIIDVKAATLKTRPKSDLPLFPYRGWHGGMGMGPWRTTIRDASWHPNADLLAAVGWNGYGSEHGSVTLHSSSLSSANKDGSEHQPPRLDSRARFCRAFYETSEVPEDL